MKTIIEMAREAGFSERDAMFRVAFVANKNNLERFAELVRADEREEVIAEFIKSGAVSGFHSTEKNT